MQVRELTAFIEARGWLLVKIFEDKASGTATKKRPQLAEMMKLANQRQIDVVAVWKMDRLARSLKDLVTMMSQLQEVGVEFVSLKDSIDLTTANGRLMAQLLGAFAEFEASMIRERVRAGIKNARMKRPHWGRRPTINSEKVLRLRSEGKSLSTIAKTIGCSKAGIAKIVNQNCTGRSLGL